MSAVWAALIAFLQSLVAPVQQMLASLATYNAGKAAAGEAALLKEQQDEAKAIAAGNAADRESALNPPGLRSGDDGYSRD